MKKSKQTPTRIFTIGVRCVENGKEQRKEPEHFFGSLKDARIKRLIDIRRHNTWEKSGGFTVKAKLPGALKKNCGADYIHELLLAPTAKLLQAYRHKDHKKRIDWPTYRREFLAQLAGRKVEEMIRPDLFDVPTVLLCACPTPNQCHRSLVLEYLQSKWPNARIEAVHL